MTIKSGTKVLIRCDDGQFHDDKFGYVKEHKARSRTVTVTYDWRVSKDGEDGVFQTDDLLRANRR